VCERIVPPPTATAIKAGVVFVALVQKTTDKIDEEKKDGSFIQLKEKIKSCG